MCFVGEKPQSTGQKVYINSNKPNSNKLNSNKPNSNKLNSDKPNSDKLNSDK